MSETNFRLLKENDLERVRFLLGLGIMEQLGTINNRAYAHPITLSIWIGLASVLVTYMKWWPSDVGETGFLRLLSPVPAFLTVAMPLMFFFDWYQRDYFDESVQKTMKEQDIQSPITYYNQSPASGFFVLERKNSIIGLVAVDASTPSTGTGKPSSQKPKTSEIAVIRHLFVNVVYRVTGIQEDLLRLAVSHAFSAKTAPLPNKVRVLDSQLQDYRKAFNTLGFRPVDSKDWDGDGPAYWTVGIYRWKFRWLEITRDEWKARQAIEKETGKQY